MTELPYVKPPVNNIWLVPVTSNHMNLVPVLFPPRWEINSDDGERNKEINPLVVTGVSQGWIGTKNLESTAEITDVIRVVSKTLSCDT